MRHIAEIELRLFQTIGDGVRRKPRPMLDAAKPLLFGGGNKLAAAQNASRGVGVIGVDAEDDQVKLTS
jgi:hypothetical protein